MKYDESEHWMQLVEVLVHPLQELSQDEHTKGELLLP